MQTLGTFAGLILCVCVQESGFEPAKDPFGHRASRWCHRFSVSLSSGTFFQIWVLGHPQQIGPSLPNMDYVHGPFSESELVYGVPCLAY